MACLEDVDFVGHLVRLVAGLVDGGGFAGSFFRFMSLDRLLLIEPGSIDLTVHTQLALLTLHGGQRTIPPFSFSVERFF